MFTFFLFFFCFVIFGAFAGVALNISILSGFIVFGILFENFLYIILLIKLLDNLLCFMMFSLFDHFRWSIRPKKEY